VELVSFSWPCRVHRDVSPAEAQRHKTALTRDSRRNSLLVRLCTEAVAEGRSVICLSDRVQHVKDLLEQYTQAGGPGGVLYVGGLTRQARQLAESEGRALFGTFSMAKEGLDIPRLDTLVLASPASDITQTVGRILRPCASKKLPLIYDVADDLILPFVRQNHARLRFYASSGYVVRSRQDGRRDQDVATEP